MTTSRRNYGKLVKTGMGGFLNPPMHPEHSFSIQSTYGDTFCMPLSSAAESDWLDPKARGIAKRLLAEWRKPALDSEAVQDWIAIVLGYFKGCYVGQNSKGEPSWNASDLRIDSTVDPVLNADLHAGVHLIRKYYPEFVPTVEHFAGAYWGTKPVAA